MVGTKCEVSDLEAVGTMFARQDTDKFFALSNRVAAPRMLEWRQCKCQGGAFTVLNLIEHRADGYGGSIGRYQCGHAGIEVSKHTLRRDFLGGGFERRFALRCPDPGNILKKHVAKAVWNGGQAQHHPQAILRRAKEGM